MFACARPVGHQVDVRKVLIMYMVSGGVLFGISHVSMHQRDLSEYNMEEIKGTKEFRQLGSTQQQ